MFKIEIETSNAAFGGSVAEEKAEIARILREAADRLEAGRFMSRVYDVNGNAVGPVEYISEKRAES